MDTKRATSPSTPWWASVSTGAGDNSLTATVLTAYDNIGNLLTVDGPLPAAPTPAASATMRRGSSSGGLAGPGRGRRRSSAAPSQQLRSTAKGLVTKVERGNVDSQSDPDWGDFASAEEVETEYDAKPGR